MKTTFALLAAALLLAATAHAQERSAGQSYDAQTNWSALKASIDGLRSQNTMIAATVDDLKDNLQKLLTCNAKHMFFTPADAAADAGGCVAVSTTTITQAGKNCGSHRDGEMWAVSCSSGGPFQTYTKVEGVAQCINGVAKTITSPVCFENAP